MALDMILAVCLLLIVPAYGMWRTAREKHAPAITRPLRYRRAIGMALCLAALLAVDWIVGGRSIAALGLTIPIARGGWIGLAIAGVVLIALTTMSGLHARRAGPATTREPPAILPQTNSERRLFVLMILVLGVTWELLYRGFLLWLLAPHIGMAASVVIAAAAYAVAHGYQGAAQFGASLASALAFTIGYALTASLWWLIVLHIGMPILGSFARPTIGNGKIAGQEA